MSPRFSIRRLSAQPDARLAVLARDGEERAFEVLVRRHRRSLAAYCRRLGVPEHRVDDVLQQSLTRAWLAFERGVDVREPRAWLHRIVHNTAMSAVRSAQLHSHAPLQEGESGPAPVAPGELDDRLRAREALGHVAALPEQQRAAIVLTAIEGRSHEEAAGVMGVSDGAVRGLVHRARTTLRRAAAAFGPQGLLGLLGRGGDSAVSGRAVEAAGAAGTAGLLGKGLLATGVGALLAVSGTLVHLSTAHRRPVVPRQESRREAPEPAARARPAYTELASVGLVREEPAQPAAERSEHAGRALRLRSGAHRVRRQHDGHGRPYGSQRTNDGGGSARSGEDEQVSRIVSVDTGGDRREATTSGRPVSDGSRHGGYDEGAGSSGAGVSPKPDAPAGNEGSGDRSEPQPQPQPSGDEPAQGRHDWSGASGASGAQEPVEAGGGAQDERERE